MRKIRKYIIANVFQIGVNIIGIPEFNNTFKHIFFKETSKFNK